MLCFIFACCWWCMLLLHVRVYWSIFALTSGCHAAGCRQVEAGWSHSRLLQRYCCFCCYGHGVSAFKEEAAEKSIYLFIIYNFNHYGCSYLLLLLFYHVIILLEVLLFMIFSIIIFIAISNTYIILLSSLL